MEKHDENSAKKDLNGVILEYTYPSQRVIGIHHVTSITQNKLDFKSPWPENGIKKEENFSGIEYKARKIQDGLYLVHWIDGFNHTVLLMDFVNKRTTCAAYLHGETEIWDVADWDRWKLPSTELKRYQGKDVPPQKEISKR